MDKWKIYLMYFIQIVKGDELSVRYCCIDSDQARRLFFSEIQKGEEIKKIVEVKEQ